MMVGAPVNQDLVRCLTATIGALRYVANPRWRKEPVDLLQVAEEFCAACNELYPEIGGVVVRDGQAPVLYARELIEYAIKRDPWRVEYSTIWTSYVLGGRSMAEAARARNVEARTAYNWYKSMPTALAWRLQCCAIETRQSPRSAESTPTLVVSHSELPTDEIVLLPNHLEETRISIIQRRVRGLGNKNLPRQLARVVLLRLLKHNRKSVADLLGVDTSTIVTYQKRVRSIMKMGFAEVLTVTERVLQSDPDAKWGTEEGT